MARLTFRWSLPFVAAILFVSGTLTGQSDYYPLTEGARFVYHIKATQQTDVVQEATLSALVVHLGAAVVQGKTVTPEGRYIDGKLAGVTFIADDETGVYYYANQNSSQKKPVLMNPIQYLIKYPVQQGATWQQQTSSFEMVGGKKLPVTLTAAIESDNELVSVPAGVFAKCLKIRMRGAIAATNDTPEFRVENQLWYAPGLGMIKQVQKEERLSQKPQAFTMVLNLQEIQYDRF